MLMESSAGPSVAPTPSAPVRTPTVVVVVPTPQVIVRDSGPSPTDTVAAFTGVLAVVIAVVAIVLTSVWNSRADRKAADRFTAASDMDALRQLNAMGIQPNAPLQPVARGLLDSLPDDDLPVWREIIKIEARSGPSVEPQLKEWLRKRELPRDSNDDQWVIKAMVDDIKTSMIRRRKILDDRAG